MYSPYSSRKRSHTSSGDGSEGRLIRDFERNNTNPGPWTSCQNEVTRIEERPRIAPGMREIGTKRRRVENETKLENNHYQQKLLFFGECCRIWEEREEKRKIEQRHLTTELGQMHIRDDDCLEELQNDINKIEAEKKQLQREIRSLEKELQKYKYQTDSDKEHYLRERDDALQKVQKYEKQLELVNSQLSQCARDDDCLEELQNDIYKIEAEKEQLQREISSLEKELHTFKYQTDSDKEHYLREKAEPHREAGIYEEMVKELKRERDVALQQVQKFEKQLELVNSQLSQCARESDTNNQSKSKIENDSRVKNLETEIQSLKSEQEQLKRLNRKVTEENQAYEQEINYIFQAKDDAHTRIQTLETDKQSLISEGEQLKRLNKKLTEDISEYKQQINKLVQARDDALTRIQTLETDTQSLITEVEQPKRLNKKLTEDISEYKQQINELVQARDDALTRVQNLETDIQSFKSEGEQLKRLNRKIMEENDRCKRQMHDLNKAKDDALTRLSKVAGAKLTHGNAAITDLSDDNRPTKIAEKFSELYDNAWTDAFEDIESLGIDEKECIHLLLSVLKRTFELCTQVEEKYEAGILHAVQTIPCVPQCQTLKELTVQTNIQVVKSLCEIRLSMENMCSQAVEKMVVNILPDFLQTLSSKFDVMNLPSKLLDYTRSCARLCWLMRIRDPPLHLQFDIRRDDAFNQEYLRQYTKSGKKVDFMVWPVLFLHTNGPLLSKGVAQPM